MRWPNIIRIDRTYKPQLSLNWKKMKALELDTSSTVQIAEIAPVVNGKPDVSAIKDIDLEKLMGKLREQTVIFRTAQTVWKDMKPNWKASPALLMAQLVGLTEQFIDSDRIAILPALFNQDNKRRRLVITLNMSKVIRHLWQAVEFNNTETMTPVFDSDHPIHSTGDMRPWRTGKPCEYMKRNHINYCVYDSTWEKSAAFILDKNDMVKAWAKNDHLGFHIPYIYNGVVRMYRPDFIIHLASGDFLVLEIKGRQTEQDDVKHGYMREWTEAVSRHGGFGCWRFDVSSKPADLEDVMEKQNNTAA